MFAFDVERVRQGEAVDESAKKGQGRRDEAARGEDQTDEEEVLVHESSVRWEGNGVQAVIVMGD